MSLSEETSSPRRWRFAAVTGLAGWLAVAAFGRPAGFGAFWGLGGTVLFAVLVLVPLAADMAARPDREGNQPQPWRMAAWLQLPAAAGAVAAVLAAPGSFAAVTGASLWFVQTLLLAGFGFTRLAWHGMLCVEELVITAGFLQLPVGGFWLLAHAAGWSLGFDSLIVLLTAIHFHYAGFLAPVVAGLVGRLVPWTSGWPRKLYRPGALSIAAAPPAIGLGIAASPALEVAAVSLLVIGFGVFAVTLLAFVVPRLGTRLPQMGLATAGMALFATMALAAWYALGEFGWAAPAPLAVMARAHGWLNAYGFATLGLLSLARLRPAPRLAAPWPPFSRLRAAGRVGSDFFERRGLRVSREPAARGLVDDLGAHARPDFDPRTIHPTIRHFYEQTAQWQLRVEAAWQPGWRWAGRIFRVFAGKTGQLNLPRAVVTEHEMEGRLLDLSDAADGRTRVRGWVRCFRETAQPVYVAAYSEHRHAGVTYMNIAFPLPGMNLTSVLRFDHAPGGAVQLTSCPGAGRGEDEGVYLVGRNWRLRLPLQETIAVRAGVEANGPACRAGHDMWLFGLRYLRLEYVMTPVGPVDTGGREPSAASR
ncbi:MAG: YndJ family protein [Limisphaerales bacterium]